LEDNVAGLRGTSPLKVDDQFATLLYKWMHVKKISPCWGSLTFNGLVPRKLATLWRIWCKQQSC
jgi:hypothetical protein